MVVPLLGLEPRLITGLGDQGIIQLCDRDYDIYLINKTWWSRGGSNSRPWHCERHTLPAELRPLKLINNLQVLKVSTDTIPFGIVSVESNMIQFSNQWKSRIITRIKSSVRALCQNF